MSQSFNIDADYVISNNKHVSGCHCVLKRGNIGGKRTLEDTSTNGTLLNGKRLQKIKEIELNHNDVITIVQRKDDPGLNVVFRFEELSHDGDDNYESTLIYEADEEGEGHSSEEGERHALEEMDGRSSEEEVGGPIKGSRKRLLDDDESLPKAKIDPSEPEPASSTSPQKPLVVKMDSMEQTLICQICQEILHDCVSLQPCMHSYCAGCYSDWMAHSSACPACRDEVMRVSKNHIVNNLVDAYLRSNPSKRRLSEDLKELDERNKITKDMLYPKKSPFPVPRVFTSSSSSSEEEEEEERGILSACPQCHHYSNAPNALPLPAPNLLHPYTCTLSTVHVSCSCCSLLMPVRSSQSSIVQRCELCFRYFCHLYWSCPGASCRGYGCIGPFKDLKLRPTNYNGILGNAYESNILKDYFDSRDLSIQDFLSAVCVKLESGEYSCSDSRLATTTNTCHVCAVRYIKELAYLYRKDIPTSALPDEVTGRMDCYWGKECRTQFNNPLHAKKFNHICERTRFS